MKNKIAWTVLLLCGLFGKMDTANAQLDATPFNIVGYIQRFTLDTPGDPRSGAKMIVNGIEVTIPRNTIIVMPATFLTPADLFDKAPTGVTQKGANTVCTNPPTGLKGSGIALDDCPAPVAPYEVTIDGNIVGNQHIAGLVHISQQALNSGAGYIKSINYATGEIFVGATITGTVTARIRVNDSEGRYGRKTSSLKLGEASNPAFTEDGRFTVDTDNPTIHSKTGFPMCLPRKDPVAGDDIECPQKNRGSSAQTNPLKIFVMGASPIPNFPQAQVCPGCDPKKQAPFEIGDYIIYSGTLAKDANGFYISAHTIEAWLGIFTEPGTKPAYLGIEVSLVGTGGSPFPNILQEVATRSVKVVGFTTDPSSSVDIFAVDIDPCTGGETVRALTTANPAAVPFGRFRVDLRRIDLNPPTREIIVYNQQVAPANNGPLPNLPTFANGLQAGQFRLPLNEYIFPENTLFGQPLIPLNFQDMTFLAQGSGPLKTRGRGAGAIPAGAIVGQLSPWPGGASRAPAPRVCP